jgi:hypothetical protein
MLYQFTIFGKNGFDPTSFNSAYDIFPLLLIIVNMALGLIGAIAFIYIIIGGIQYITSAGAESKQAEAKKSILAALVGIMIVLGAFSLTNWLLRELKFNDTINKNINESIKKEDPNYKPVIE